MSNDEILENNNATQIGKATLNVNVSHNLNCGYDYEFVLPLDGKYECSICLSAIRNPMQTVCGHRFCHDCILNWLSDHNKECPIDKNPLNENDLFHDSCIEREILSLKVKCPNKSLGCNASTELKYIENHIHACSYQPLLCPNECSVTVLQKELQEHLSANCLCRLVACKYCDTPHIFNQQQLHFANCPQAIVTCDLCSMSLSRDKIAEHRKDDCPNMEIPCSFVEHGCKFQVTRSDMNIHIQQSIELHVQLLSKSLKKNTALVLDVYRNLGQIANGNFSRQPSFKSQLSTSSFQDQTSGPLERSSDLGGATGGSFAHSISFFPQNPLDEKAELNIEEESYLSQSSALKNIEKGCSEEDDLKPCKSQLSSSCTTPTVNQEKILKDLSGKSLDIDQRVLENSIKISNLARRVTSLENCIQIMARDLREKFNNGVLVWRIHNFLLECNAMKDENKVLHSQSFYSSQFGYKFCLRTNVFNINDISYLTLYIHMMQGENDDFLDWPFKGKVSLKILDCGDHIQKLHFTEDFEVSDKMEAFMRPRSLRSIKGYGFKEFISVDELCSSSNGCIYLKKDSIYIKAEVTSSSI